MIERRSKAVLDVTRLLDEPGIHELVKVLEVIYVLGEKLELIQHAGFFGGEFGELRVVENLKESNLKGRYRSDAIHGDTALLPLAGNAGIAVEEGGDKVGLVAVKVILGLLAGVVAEQGFGKIVIDGGGETDTKHLRRDGHVQKLEPAAHGGQERVDIAVAGAEGVGFQSARRCDLVLEKVTQEVEVEALHDLENGEFPIEVDCQASAPRYG